MNRIKGLERGMGIGGWLTNYKRFNVLTDEQKKALTNTAKDMSKNIQDMFQSIAEEREKLEEQLKALYAKVKINIKCYNSSNENDTTPPYGYYLQASSKLNMLQQQTFPQKHP